MAKYWEITEGKKHYWTETSVRLKQWTTDELAPFYKTTAWKNIRRIYITNHPICELCKKIDLAVMADVVDHITPIRLGGERLDFDNLQALCHPCHNSKTARERSKKHI